MLSSDSVAQSWTICVPPSTTSFLSTDYSRYLFGNELAELSYGLAGTANFFGTANNTTYCYTNALSMASVDRLGLASGPTGSIQTTMDDDMSYTFGYPYTGGTASWNMLVVNNAGTETRTFINAAPTIAFVGLSDRYCYREITVNGFNVTVQHDVLGDAVRVQWKIVNANNAVGSVGLYTGMSMALFSPTKAANNEVFISGWGNGSRSKDGYVYVPGIRPPRTERRFIRTIDGAVFPNTVDFLFSQAEPYGLRVNNGPLDDKVYDTNIDSIAADTQADEFVIGSAFFLMNWPADTTTPADFTFAPTGSLISDVDYRNNVGYIQKFYPKTTDNQGTRRIVQYYHTPWSVADYGKPYVVVVDTPKVLTYAPGNVNSVGPQNPSTWRVYVDNAKGFSTIDREITLFDVRVTLRVKKDSGFTITSPTPADEVVTENGKQVTYSVATQILDVVQPRRMRSVDFTVQASGTQNGYVPYEVVVDPAPVPKKSVKGQILASTTPRLVVRQSANLVTAPWTFTDSSWTNILGLQATQFRAFSWDPIQGSYVVSTGSERGRGQWLISSTDFGTDGISLQGSPSIPVDIEDGARAITLKPGWNLFGNPYSYPIQLGQMTGYAASSPNQSVRWSDLVTSGFVNPFVAYWTNDGSGSGTYSYVQGDAAELQPNFGYWIFNNTSQDIIIQFPPVYLPYVQGTSRSAKLTAPVQQTAKDWRLQLVARSNTTIDDSNFIGVGSDTKAVRSLQVYKAPTSPVSDVSLFMEGTANNGRAVRMAQKVSDNTGPQSFDFKVESTKSGDVTVTWPNLKSMPTNLRLRLTDSETGVTRNMRMVSGYTFTAKENSTRAFRVDVENGNDVRPLIGDVNIVSPTRGDANGVYSINYSLNTEATTSVRILSGSREVLALVRGRADKAGQNSTTWNLRDGANRAVAPGAYRVEIVAETNTGDRVRKIVTINVVR